MNYRNAVGRKSAHDCIKIYTVTIATILWRIFLNNGTSASVSKKKNISLLGHGSPVTAG